MKHIFALIMLLWCASAFGQVTLGLRDTHYAQVGYSYQDRWSATLEHSVYSEHMGYQKVRLMLGYKQTFDEKFTININPYASSLWNGDYQDFGVLANAEAKLAPMFAVDITANPHYDAGADYTTCLAVGTTIQFHKDVALVAHYTTIPEYRLSEKRIRAGLDFKVQKLWVRPELSIPVEGEVKTVRVLCSMRYKF